MNYEKANDQLKRGKRVITYRNTSTGTEVDITPIYKTIDGTEWWGFMDLHKVPYIRTVMSKHISDLFTIGLSLKDILKWCQEEKTILKSDDPEKYEKLYALILEKEQLASHTADPVKLHLALATVYVLTEDERIDYFTEEDSLRKIELWKSDPKAIGFFLSWHSRHILTSMQALEKTFKTVSGLDKLTNLIQ